jgi:hypothetical protein
VLVAQAWGCWVVRNDEWLVWYMWGAGGGVKIAGGCCLGELVVACAGGEEWGRVGQRVCE